MHDEIASVPSAGWPARLWPAGTSGLTSSISTVGPARLEETLAQEALGEALHCRCLGGSWRGLVRGLAWRVVSAGGRNPRAIEPLAEAGEELFATLIDDALREVERVAAGSYRDFLEACPGDEEGAVAAARLDAREESAHRIDSACERVVEELLTATRRAA